MGHNHHRSSTQTTRLVVIFICLALLLTVSLLIPTLFH
jgi:hypothetical protein